MFAAVSLALSGYAYAEDGPVSLPQNARLADYVKVGLVNHPGLRSDYEEYLVAMQREPQVASLPDPVASYTNMFEEVQTRTGPQENLLSISQTVPWMGKLRLKSSIASREAEAALREYEQHRLHLIRDISIAYYDYAYLGKESAITQETLTLLRRLEESVTEKVRVGGDYSASLRLEVEMGKTEDRLRGLSRDRARKTAVLKALLGGSGAAEGLLPWPSLSESSVPREGRALLKERLLAQSPRLKAIDEKISAADERVRLAKKSPIPDPTIGVNYIDIGGAGEDAVGVTLGFRIPFGRKKYKAERLEAEARRRAIQGERAEEENKLIEELEASLSDLGEAADRVELYRDKLLSVAEEAVEVSETSYASGKAGILEVIDSERTLLDLQKIYWRAVADTRASLIELQTLVGTEEL